MRIRRGTKGEEKERKMRKQDLSKAVAETREQIEAGAPTEAAKKLAELAERVPEPAA